VTSFRPSDKFDRIVERKLPTESRDYFFLVCDWNEIPRRRAAFFWIRATDQSP
jgi:hypothetical protein